MRPIAAATFVFTCLLTISTPVRLSAQEPFVGSRVRIDAPGYVGKDYVGFVLARTPDTVRVISDGGGQVAIPVARMRSLEVSRGRSRAEGAVHGMKWTVPIMAAFGAVVAVTTHCSSASTHCREPDTNDRVGFAAAMTLSGVMWGAGVGAIVGRERWVPVSPLESVTLRADATHLGVRIALGHLGRR